MGACLVALLLGGFTAAVVVSAPNRELERLRADLAAELEEARSRTPVARAAREPSVQAEIFSQIDAALARVGSRTPAQRGALQHLPYLESWPAPRPDTSAVLKGLAADLAPVVSALQLALHSDSCDSSLDARGVRASWKDHYSRSAHWRTPFWYAVGAFTVTALDEIEADRASAAARLLVDLRELTHVLAGRSGLVELAEGATRATDASRLLIPHVIERLAESHLGLLDEELSRLDSRFPSFTRAIERDQLVLEAGFVGEHLYSMRKPPAALDSLLARSARRHLALFRPLNELYTKARGKLGAAEPWRARAAMETFTESELELWGHTRVELSCTGNHNGPPHETTESLSNLLDATLIDRAQIRIARALVAARRFEARSGSWPASHAEALGREPRVDERDPFTGAPLVFTTTANGALCVETARFQTDVELMPLRSVKLSIRRR